MRQEGLHPIPAAGRRNPRGRPKQPVEVAEQGLHLEARRLALRVALRETDGAGADAPQGPFVGQTDREGAVELHEVEVVVQIAGRGMENRSAPQGGPRRGVDRERVGGNRFYGGSRRGPHPREPGPFLVPVLPVRPDARDVVRVRPEAHHPAASSTREGLAPGHQGRGHALTAVLGPRPRGMEPRARVRDVVVDDHADRPSGVLRHEDHAGVEEVVEDAGHVIVRPHRGAA